MASKPDGAAQQLPVLYASLTPISSQQHADYGIVPRDNLELLRGIHAVPLTTDEFISAQRNFPIIFASGDNPVPLALMGLREGSNVFVDKDGHFPEGCYVPAYVRRYPFMLARVNPQSEELTLCADDSSKDFAEGVGERLFENGEQTDVTKNVLQFCEKFEEAVFRTSQFGEELKKLDLLIDGEVSIEIPGAEKPAVYRGFKMVSEDKLKELRGDQLRKIVPNGILALVHAHLMSLSIIRELFVKDQRVQAEAAAEPAPAA